MITQSTPWPNPSMNGTQPTVVTSMRFSCAAAIIGGPAANFTKAGASPAFSKSFRSLATNSSQSVFD